MMDNVTAQTVKETFGTVFQQYCLRRKISLKQDENGAFAVPDTNTLRECIQVLNRHKYKLDKRLKTLQKSTLPANYSNRGTQSLSKQNKTDGTEKRKLYKNTNVNLFFNDIEITIYLYNTSTVLPSYKSHTFLTNYAFNTAKSGNEIYDFIIKETMQNVTITDYEVSIPLIVPLLEEFQKRHKKFHYFSILKHLDHKQEVLNEKSKCKYEVTKQKLRSFFDLIFAKVVPLNIFGKLRNLKKIKKTMFNLLEAPCFKSFDLKPLIERLDIAPIIWLKNIKSTKTKWLVIMKLVRWLFVEFLLKILYTYFHITTSGTNNKRLYIIRANWNSVQKKFVKKRIRSHIFQPDVKLNEWNPPIGTYKLFPKYSTVRPIFKPQCTNTDKNHLYTIHKFLKQLHTTNYGITDFQKKWKLIVKRNRKMEQMYLVSCDVVDAFGSVIQEQLYDIIKSLCDDLPDSLALKYYVLKSERKKDSDVIYRQYFSDPYLSLPFAPGTLYAHTNYSRSQWIKKKWLLDRISSCIFYQRVQIKKKIFMLGKGLVQGTMLSPILSDIYYNFILHKKMTTFLRTGQIIKYMDDILYVTKSEISAVQFLHLTKRGIPQYNCYFKQAKTQSNVAFKGNAIMNNITYIGYKINCTTLNLKPKRSNTDIRYLISFSTKCNLTPLQLLKKRLDNIATFKISKVMLDSTINSTKAIRKILNRICLLQAKRACILIKELFSSVQTNVGSILKIIKNNNEQIARYVIKILLTSERNMNKSTICAWNNYIMYTLWISYKAVFKKDRILHKYFTTSFLQTKINSLTLQYYYIFFHNLNYSIINQIYFYCYKIISTTLNILHVHQLHFVSTL
ncbi:telomerase reverse transcriptase [Xylocopa sonorina]|uniref:telomerase reverse transcriptase n=1 Tax=Xylocopa sonorina TaxID=1818115 RepID=UPI00403AE408